MSLQATSSNFLQIRDSFKTAIHFHMDENGFSYCDASDDVIQGLNEPDFIFIPTSPDAKFINCKFKEIQNPKGSVSLDSCTVGKVSAKMNVLFSNQTQANYVVAGNEIACLNSSRFKKAFANTTYIDRNLPNAKVIGNLCQLSNPQPTIDQE